jgi:uncharacterized protein YodC (DUF2158 family)
MSDQMKAGDIVQLSPGGPKMFLSKIENIDGVKWHGVLGSTAL